MIEFIRVLPFEAMDRLECWVPDRHGKFVKRPMGETYRALWGLWRFFNLSGKEPLGVVLDGSRAPSWWTG